MSRPVTTGSTDQSIRFWAYDSDGAAVTGEAYNSAGMAVSVAVRSAGRIVSTTALTLVARSGVGVHTDSALTEVGGGEYVVDLPDSYSATAERDISLTVASTAITGAVLVEMLAVGQIASPTNITAATGVALSSAGVRAIWNDDWNSLVFAPDRAGAYVQRISTNVDGLVNTLGPPAGASVSADIAAMLAVINALENLSAAEVNAEMLDVLNVDTFGELAAPPAASSTLRDKLTWIFMCHRNLRTETATQRKLFADNGSTLVGTEAVSDDGTTFTKGEVA